MTHIKIAASWQHRENVDTEEKDKTLFKTWFRFRSGSRTRGKRLTWFMLFHWLEISIWTWDKWVSPVLLLVSYKNSKGVKYCIRPGEEKQLFFSYQLILNPLRHCRLKWMACVRKLHGNEWIPTLSVLSSTLTALSPFFITIVVSLW